MLHSTLANLRRCGALTCILALSLALAACGDDTESNNGTNNGADTGMTDTGDQDAGNQDSGDQDAGGDAGGDANDEDGDTSTDPLEISGVYESDYGSVETITDDEWTIEADWGNTTATIVQFDNDENSTVTQDPETDGEPGAFNKIVWTEPGTDGAFYYCTVTFGEETAEDAANTDQTADESDLEGEGCGGFPWTLLTPMAPQ